MMEKEENISEGQAGFRPNRSCVDHVHTLGKMTQGIKDARRTTYCFFLDVQRAYDTVWRNGLREKLWEIGVKGRMRIDEKHEGICEKCCDAGRGNIEMC